MPPLIASALARRVQDKRGAPEEVLAVDTVPLGLGSAARLAIWLGLAIALSAVGRICCCTPRSVRQGALVPTLLLAVAQTMPIAQAAAAAPEYYSLIAGRCADEVIADMNVCTLAANALGLGYQEVPPEADPNDPSGCLLLAPSAGAEDQIARLQLNKVPLSMQNCGLTRAGMTVQCLCKHGYQPPSPPALPPAPPFAPSPPAQPPLSPGLIMTTTEGYYTRNAGSCGGETITDQSTCNVAAEALRLIETTSSPSSDASLPKGCILSFSVNGHLHLVHLLLVSTGASEALCSDTHQCVCQFTPPSPPVPPPLLPGVTRAAGAYYMINAGTCGSGIITDRTACDAAATVLELSDTSLIYFRIVG